MMPDISSQDDFLTVSELAQQWRVSEGHLYNLIKRQELRAVTIGGRYIVQQSEAQFFIERNATFARAQAA